MLRPTGFISDIPCEKDASVGQLLGAGMRICDKAWLVDNFRFDLDQNPNGACVAFAIASIVWAAQGIANVPDSERLLISADMLYHNTLRRMHGKNATLLDKGSRPRDAIATLNEIGVCMWNDWPHDETDPGRCLKDPPGDLQLVATDCDWIKSYRIDSSLKRKEQAIACMCAETPWPVACALTLDQPYFDLQGDPWPGRTGTAVGRHYVALCGFDSTGPFVGTTWGPSWAIGGLGQITWDAFLSFETTDVVAFQVDVNKMPGR